MEGSILFGWIEKLKQVKNWPVWVVVGSCGMLVLCCLILMLLGLINISIVSRGMVMGLPFLV